MITYEHGNADGTGSRLAVDIQAAEGKAGSATFRICQQDGWLGDGHPKFRADGVGVTLGIVGITHVLNVLEGAARSILGGKGTRTREDGRAATLHVDSVREPFVGFAVHVRSRRADGGTDDGRIVLSRTEGASLMHALRASMGRIAFGDK